MKIALCTCLMLVLPYMLGAQTASLSQRMSFEFSAITLAEAISRIDEATDYAFTYNPAQLPATPLSKSYHNQELSFILNDLLSPAGLEYAVRGRIIVIVPTKTRPRPPEFTVSGYVEDMQTGERLPGAGIYDLNTRKGTITNGQGFFSLKLPADSVRLVVSSVGYAVQYERFRLSGNERRLVKMKPDLELQAVEILDADTAISMDELSGASVVRIPVADLERLPALMGEPDVLNVLALMPGVQTGGGVSGGMYVRGGSPDQNLILLDGVPIYNSGHLFGLYSIFNSDVLKSVELIKGGFPARFGGRLSSVVDLRMKEGNQNRIAGKGSLGLVTAKMMLEGPIVQEKVSFLLSGRRTVLEPYWLLVNRLADQAEGNRLGYSFYDLNGKLSWRAGKRDVLELGYYTGGDRFASGYRIAASEVDDEFDFGLKWGNTAGVLRWSRDWSPKLYSDVSIFTTRYDYSAQSRTELERPGRATRTQLLDLTSTVDDWGGRVEFNYLPGPGHFVRFGAVGTRHSFLPETFQQSITDSSVVVGTNVRQQQLQSWEMGAFIEDNLALTDKLSLNLGLHYSRFHVDSSSYQSLQPRLSMGAGLAGRVRVTASFASMVQYLHLLSNSGVGLPTDLWVPATSRIPPQTSRQFSLGVEKRFGKLAGQSDAYRFSVEGYYKRMDSLIDYQTGVNFLAGRDWQDIVVRGGEGWSYGMEVFLQKMTGRWRGWLGYTLAKTERRFETINGGEAFPYKYDRRHDLSAVVIFELNDRIEFSANWLYGSGTAITFPNSVFYAPSSPLLGFSDLNGDESVGVIVSYGDRNSFRLPAFHRLDLNMRIRKKRKWGETYWNFGVYNAYNRQNPLFLFLRADYSQDPNAPEIKARKMSLLPILPEVNFGFRF